MKLTPENVNEWLVYRKENRLPHPPLTKIRYAGHWILYRYGEDNKDGSGCTDIVIMQWNPVSLSWYHSGQLATNASCLTMQGWRTGSEVEFLEIPSFNELIILNEEINAF